MHSLDHEHYMRQALRQAELAAETGEVPAGCVIVTTVALAGHPAGAVIGRAHNQVELLRDPTAHAEILAITQACSARHDWRLADTVLYVTKEPCVMCAGAIVAARVPLVVFGTPDPRRGGVIAPYQLLQSPHLNHRSDYLSGVLEEPCRALLQAFFRERRARPDAGAAADMGE